MASDMRSRLLSKGRPGLVMHLRPAHRQSAPSDRTEQPDSRGPPPKESAMGKPASTCVLLVVSAVLLVPRASADDGVTLRCGRLLDPGTERVLNDVSVRVEGGRVTAVGAPADAAAAATVIDLRSLTCLPGLIDLHAHILINPGDVL